MRLKIRPLDELLVAVALVVGFFTLYCTTDPNEPLPPGMCDLASISSPVDGSEYWEGDTIHFEFSGEDYISETPFLRTNLQFTWMSNVDKLIGNTPSFDRNDLSVGAHTITLIVSRTRRPPLLPVLLCTYTTTINVVPKDVCSKYGITKPKDGDTFDVNDAVELLYEAPDTTIESVTWESSRDYYLGLGNPVTVQSLSKGDHTITAQATLLLSTGARVECQDTVGINVVSVCDASISPANNATFLEGDPVVCSYAVPAGTLTSVDWTVDGQGLGVGTPFTINGLSDGEHTIVAYALVITPGGLEVDCVNVVQITVENKPAPTNTLPPDTGQERCYSETAEIVCPQPTGSFYGQDAQYVTVPMSFTNNGNATVTDNVTGLVWQKEDDNTSYNWEGATSMCTALNLDGAGWRLPSRRELLSILNVGRTDNSSPAIDQTYFPGIDANAYYWTSTTYVSDATFAWTVRFSDGVIGNVVKSNQFNFVTRVLCVRGASYLPGNAFSDNLNGTVTDSATGLVWQKQDDGILREWEDALSYCENSTLGGFEDWKLPDVKELESIVKVTGSNPFIDTSFFSTLSTNPFVEPYWSSTPIVSITGPSRYVVGFSIGSVNQNFSFGWYSSVRCVRRP